jgi:hypothetical protein
MSANGQIAWVVELQFIIYMMQLTTTHLQLYQNNSFSIIMQPHYNCTHNVMLMLLIVTHLLIFDTWPYEDFFDKDYFLFKILISIVHYDC